MFNIHDLKSNNECHGLTVILKIISFQFFFNPLLFFNLNVTVLHTKAPNFIPFFGDILLLLCFEIRYCIVGNKTFFT